MPMKPSSAAIKIKFVHVAKDGRTPVFDSSVDKWVYKDAPTASEMEASQNRLKAADLATNTANAAKVAADNAQKTADSKVSAQEALDTARDNLFEIVPSGSHAHMPLRSIEFKEGKQGAWKVWVNFGSPDAPVSSLTHGWLDYAENDVVADLLTRVEAIEKKLGIS